MTEKRFINDIDNGKLIDTKGELSTIHYSDKVDFYELWEFLNKLNDENEQLKKENYELHKRLGDFEQFEEHIKERTSKTFVKKCVYFNSVHGVCDIDGSVDCPCENYEELVRWIE